MKARTYRLLLVDDDDIFEMLLRESITEHAELCDRFVLDRFKDGDEALASLLHGSDGAVDSGRARPDIILLDQRMPRQTCRQAMTSTRGCDRCL